MDIGAGLLRTPSMDYLAWHGLLRTPPISHWYHTTCCSRMHAAG
jgi:hypothetical protein